MGVRRRGSLTWTARHCPFWRLLTVGECHQKSRCSQQDNTQSPSDCVAWITKQRLENRTHCRENHHNPLQVTQVLVGYAGTRVAGAGELDKCPKCYAVGRQQCQAPNTVLRVSAASDILHSKAGLVYSRSRIRMPNAKCRATLQSHKTGSAGDN